MKNCKKFPTLPRKILIPRIWPTISLVLLFFIKKISKLPELKLNEVGKGTMSYFEIWKFSCNIINLSLNISEIQCIRYKVKITHSSNIKSNNITAWNINSMKRLDCFGVRQISFTILLKSFLQLSGWYRIKIAK